jgi:hypothetical protein
MRGRSIVCLLLSVGVFVSSSHAQTGDWQAVKDIPLGSYIVVKSVPTSTGCYFVNATDTELFCDQRGLRIDFHRQNIRQVRLDHPQKSLAVGTLVGIGAGIGIGVAVGIKSNDAETKVYAPIAFGALFGAVSGLIMGKLVVVHGKVVYRR